MVPLPGGDRW